MTYGILHLATPELMDKQAFWKAVPGLLGKTRGALKPKPGSTMAMPAGQAIKQGLGKAKGYGGKAMKYGVPILGGGVMAHQAFFAPPVTDQHLQQAHNQAYLAAHNQIGNRLGQGGFLQSMALKFDPSLAYGQISKATGAPVPGYQAGQQPAQYVSMQAPATAAQHYNQTTRNF